MIVYKVVTVGQLYTDSERFFSARIIGHSSESRLFTVEYRVGKTVSAKYPGTKLFAFRTVEDAIFFTTAREVVFKAEASDVSVPKTIVYCGSLEAYYQDNFDDDIELRAPPEGTLLCGTIKLIEKVYAKRGSWDR